MPPVRITHNGNPALPSDKSLGEIPEEHIPLTRPPGLVHHSGLTTHSLILPADGGDLQLLGSRQAINDDIYVHFLVTVRLYSNSA